MDQWIEQLRKKISAPLPGQEVQYRMAPMSRPRPGNPFLIPEGAYTSAVLLLLYPHELRWHLPLMVRTPDQTAHSRQVSLPGGRTEPDDVGFEHTALREAEEEVGVKSGEVEVLGKLTPLFIPVSNFYVQPVVGLSLVKPAFQPDPREVEKLLEIPVDYLHDEQMRSLKKITISTGLKMEVPCYEFQGHTVWGATAMILSEFSELINPQDRFEKHP